MTDQTLTIHLEPVQGQPCQYLLSWGSIQYPLGLRPENSHTFSELLRHLPDVLMGRDDSAFLRAIGERLWNALFPETAPQEARDGLIHALRAETTPVLLTVPEPLLRLPWELLYDPECPADTGFIARRRPLLRLISAGGQSVSLNPPLRVLVLISSPPELGEWSRVDVESERVAIEQATRESRESGWLHLLIEDIVTPERVHQTLIRFRPHIVHYIGHGGYERETGGVLLWENDAGERLPYAARKLAELLRPRNLQAVVLHACETASRHSKVDLPNLAETLVHAGIPVVLAQQASLSYESSQRASHAWYTALTSGLSFAEALFEARQMLSQVDRPDWAVPVLYGSKRSVAPLLNVSIPPSSPDPELVVQGAVVDLPAPTGVFVGRHREMRELRLMLEQAPGSGPVLALITGPGGIGKSTLVAQAVARYGKHYKGALTLHCTEYQKMSLFLQRMGEFLKEAGAPTFLKRVLPDPALSIQAKVEAVVESLKQGGPFLILVDNLEKIQNEDRTLCDKEVVLFFRSLMRNLGRGGRILITGRYRVENLLPDDRFQANLLLLNLEDLSAYETRQLIAQHPRLKHLGVAVQDILVQEFGGIPYTYDLLASKANSQSPYALIYDIQGRMTEERKKRSEKEWMAIRQRVIEFAALNATVQRLPTPARKLLACISLFQQPFPLDALEQGLQATQETWQPLLDWSLLRLDPFEHTYRIHEVTRYYVQDCLSEQDRLSEQERPIILDRLASWYERYARLESYNLNDYLEAYRLWQEAGSVQQAGRLAMQLATLLRRFGHYNLLRDLCETTLKTAQGVDEILEGSALRELGIVALIQGKYEEARPKIEKSLDIFKRLGEQSNYAAALHQLGILKYYQHEYEEAHRTHLESLAIFQHLEDKEWQAGSLYQLGLIAREQGNYEEAHRLSLESLELYVDQEDQGGRASCLHQLGMIAREQGKKREAWEFFQKSLKIFKRLGDQSGQGSSLHELGRIAHEDGEDEEARRLFQESLEISERLGDQSGKASSLSQLGILALLQGDYEEARLLHKKGQELDLLLGNHARRAKSLYMSGRMAQWQKKYGEAQQIYQECLRVFEELGDQAERANSLYQLGMIAREQGKYEEARLRFEESLEIFGRLDGRGSLHHECASSLYQLGILAQEQGEYDKAREMYQKSLTIFRNLGDEEQYAQSLHLLGTVVYLQRDFKEAGRLCQESLAIFGRLNNLEGTATGLGQLGAIAYSQGDLEQALRYTLQAFKLFQDLQSPSLLLVQRTIIQIRQAMGEDYFAARWRSITGSSSIPSLFSVDTQQESLQTMAEFLNISDLRASQQFLEAHPDLLLPKMDVVFQNLLMMQKEKRARFIIEEGRRLLIRCREAGISTAFDEKYIREVVAFHVTHKNVEERQNLAKELQNMQRDKPFKDHAFAHFIGCLIALLRNEIPAVDELEPLFLEQWQQLQLEIHFQLEHSRQGGENQDNG